MTEKLLILGSNSFSGAHFADYALAQGLDVVGISRSAEPDALFLPYRQNTRSDFKFYSLDINHQLDEIIAIIRKFRPDYVVNFAAQGMVAQSWNAPHQWLQTNLLSAVRLHEELRTCDFLKSFVQASTPEVYGNCSQRIDENTAYNPSTPYAVSKAACDMSLQTYFHNYGFPVVTTRSANVYGPGQQLFRIIPRTILCIRQGKKLSLHGGGAAQRSFIHIHDVCVATLALARSSKPGETYHIATGEVISIRNLVELICQKMHVNFHQHVAITDSRPGEDSAYLLDSRKIRSLTGWRDQIDLDSGLDQTIEWFEKNYDKLNKLPGEYVHKE